MSEPRRPDEPSANGGSADPAHGRSADDDTTAGWTPGPSTSLGPSSTAGPAPTPGQAPTSGSSTVLGSSGSSGLGSPWSAPTPAPDPGSSTAPGSPGSPGSLGLAPDVGLPPAPGPAPGPPTPIPPEPAHWGPWPSAAPEHGSPIPAAPPGPLPYATAGLPGTGPSSSAADRAASAPGWQPTPPGDGWRERGRRSEGPGSGPIVFGLLLILGGSFLLARELVPDLRVNLVWPVTVMALGAVLIVLAFLRPPRDRRR